MRLRDQIAHAELRGLYDWWEEKRRLGPVLREHVQPEALRSWLPTINLIDCLPDGRFRYRLTGTTFDRHLGRNLTGMLLDEARSGRTLELLRTLLSSATAQDLPGYAVSRLSDEARPLAIYHRIALPLHQTADGPVTTILGAWYIEWNPSTPSGTMAFYQDGQPGMTETEARIIFGSAAPDGPE